VTRDPSRALDAITLTKTTSTHWQGTPWISNLWMPGNTRAEPAGDEYSAYEKLRSAAGDLNHAEAALKNATDGARAAQDALGAAAQKLDAAKAASSRDPSDRSLKRAVLGAEVAHDRASARAKRADEAQKNASAAKTAAEAHVQRADAEFKTFLKDHMSRIRSSDPTWSAANARVKQATSTPERDDAIRARAAREKELSDAVDAYTPIQQVSRTQYRADVGGTQVWLQDRVDAYSTDVSGGFDGYGAGGANGGQDTVRRVVDASSVSASDKKIMLGIASREGGFASINTYDNGYVTWGFNGWTTGKDGDGDLMPVLARAKREEPAAFEERFGKYGIDVDDGKLTVTQAGGNVLRGAAAVDALRTDPKLAAVFGAAGTDPKLQNVQVEQARDGLISDVRSSSITVNKQSYRYADVITSEYGTALMSSAAAHAGVGALKARMQAGLEAFLAAHPEDTKANLASWRYEAEKSIWATLTADDGDRARNFLDNIGTSQAEGSYQ
jgi:hypothetical protein